MKLYVFYRIRLNEKVISDNPELYAWTINKEHVDRFVEERDMNIFHMVKRSIDKDGELFKEFELRYKSMELTSMNIYTRDEGFHNKKHGISILTTWAEYNVLFEKTESIVYELMKYVSESYYHLKKEYRTALDVLYYPEIQRFKLAESRRGFSDDFEMNPVDIDCDEFTLYMQFFGTTYK